jgi:hypothetical protein
VRLTNADKRHRVEVALAYAEMSKWSNRRLADLCGVDHKTVANLRSGPTGENPRLATVGRDGRARRPRRKKKVEVRPEQGPDDNGKAVAPAAPEEDDGRVELAVAVRIAEDVIRDEYTRCQPSRRMEYTAALRGVCDDLDQLTRDS